jgi:hypothetical protein
VQVRPFIERCPHSNSVGVAGATGSAGWLCAGRTIGLEGLETADDLTDLSLYRASRIARSAASLLIVNSPDEL